MKKLILKGLAAFALIAIMSSCAATHPICATSNSLGSKKGEASQFYFIGFACTEGGTIEEAAKEAGITKVSHIEVQTQPFWPIVGKKRTIVYGE